jgi:hypothetical protein
LLEEAQVDVPVVGVLVEPGVPNRLLGVEAGALEEAGQRFLEKLLGPDPVVAVGLAVDLLERDHAVPDAGLGLPEFRAQFLLLLFVEEPLSGEDAGGLLVVPGVVDVIPHPGGLDALVDVREVVIRLAGRIEVPAGGLHVVVMHPHDDVRCCCHRRSLSPFP